MPATILSPHRTIKYNGELTASVADQVRQTLLSMVCEKTEVLHLDLRGVEQSDMSGINTIILINKRLQEKNMQLTIKLKKGSSLANLFHLTKFSQVLSLSFAK